MNNSAQKIEKLQEEMADLYPMKEGFKVSSSSLCEVSSGQKWRISLLSGIIFLIIASPLLFKLVDGLVKSVYPDFNVVDFNGTPTIQGVVLHSVVFILVTRLLMK